MATFSELLAYFQVQAGLTKEELAQNARLSVRQIEFLLSGERHPTSASRLALCAALGLSEADRAALMAATHGPSPSDDPDRSTVARGSPGAHMDSTAGKLLRHYRLLAGWSQDELARRAAASGKYIQQLESGERHPGWRILKRISGALRLSRHDQVVLFNAAGGVPTPTITQGQPSPAIYDPGVPSLIGLKGLVGRDTQIASLKRRLTGGDHGPVSVALLGIPGAGKTTMAAALAHDPALRGHFAHGVLWGDLGPHPDIAGQYVEWARLLGVPHSASERAATAGDWKHLLRDAIGDRRLLLILDDAWTFEDAQALCVGGPNCALLVTTRAPTIAHEMAGQETIKVEELDGDHSVQLLWDVAPSLLETASAEARRLERALVDMSGGLPLALALMGAYIEELCKSRQAPESRATPSSGPRTRDRVTAHLWSTLQRLGSARSRVHLSRANPLTGQAVSLHAAIAMSEQRLTEDEREAFRSLAIMPPKPGHFSWETALAVSAAPERALERLLTMGLIERYTSVDGGESGGGSHERAYTRFTLHQTVNDYARAEGLPEIAGQRMARYFAEYAERHATDFLALARERSNLLEALTVSFERSLRDELVRMVIACAGYFQARALNAVIEIHLARAEESARMIDNQRALVSILNYRALNADHFGHEDEASDFLLKAIKYARRDGDESNVAQLCVTLGVIKSRLAQYKQATTNLKRADAIAARLGLRPLRAAALQQLSANAFAQGHSDESIAYARQGLTLAREMGDQAQVSGLLSALGNMTSNLGRYQEAATYLLESLSIALDLGNRIRAAFVSTNLGTVYINLGDYAEAARHLDVALRIGEETQHHLRIAFALVIRGQLACARGDDDEAQPLFQRALTLLERLDRPDRLLDLYLHFAELEMERDDIPRARAYLRRAQEISKTMQDYPELRAIMLLRTGECIERSCQRSEVARLDRAATLFEETLSIGRSLRHAELICSARVAMGRLYLKRQRYTLAESAFRAALEGELEHRPLEATARFGLAQALAAQPYDARDGSGDLDSRHAEALREVELSLALFERIGHRRARAVRLWARRLSYAPRI